VDHVKNVCILMGKKINKQKLIDAIYKKLDGVVTKNHIHDVINIVCDWVAEELIANRSVTIKNFGTLSSYIFHGHDAVNIGTRIREYVPEFWSVKFRSHHVFKRLVRRRRKSLAKKA